MAQIFFDISRLICRDNRNPPAGIDRLEFSYLDYFLNQPIWGVRFFWIHLGRFRRVSKEEARELRARVVSDWISRNTPEDLSVSPSSIEQSRLKHRLASNTRIRASIGLIPIRRMAWNRSRVAGDRTEVKRLILTVSHANMAETVLWRRLKQGFKATFAVFLHDLIPVRSPEFAPEGDDQRFTRGLAMIANTADLVFTNSAFTAQDFRSYCKENRLPMPQIEVMRLGVSSTFRAQAQPKSDAHDAPLFVMIGRLDPRKNHNLILAIWRQLIADQGRNAPRLMIIGRKGEDSEHLLRLVKQRRSFQGIVSVHSNFSDAQCSRALRQARALLFPSYAEGYGLPVVEAIASGVPVLCSSIPVLREIAGAIPEYIDPIDGAGWKQAIKDYAMADSPRRRAQLQRLHSAVTPTWDEHFETFSRHLVRLLGSNEAR
jgi:glycosyltransferase involved in cell wall biosynthesis